MKRINSILFVVMITTALASTALLAAKVQDIPVTTTSQEALASFEKAQYLLDVGRPQQANEMFRQAVAKDPTFSYAYFNLSNSSASAQEFKEDLDLGMKNIAGKSDGEKLLIQINQTFIDNDAGKRLTLAKELVTKYPDSPRAWLTLGFMQATINDHKSARESFRKALALNPNLVATHFALGFSYLFNDPRDLTQALKFMQSGTALNPKEARGYENQGDVYRAMNQLEKAREAYSKAIELDATLGIASLKKGHIDSFLGNFDEARSDYDQGLKQAKDANKINFANYRAFTNIYAGKPEEAIQELNGLLDSADKMNIPHDQLPGAQIFTLTNALTIALHYKMIPESEQLLTELRAATDANNKMVGNPDFTRQSNAAILLFDSQLAACKGDYKTALAKAEENRSMVEKDDNPRKLEGYYGAIAYVELLQKNYQKAADDYRKANLTVIYTKYHLALALDGAGNHAEALKLFQDVGKWNFNSVDFALVRGDALKRTS
jgi:tetratricopeptide (TPR) repeat protein